MNIKKLMPFLIGGISYSAEAQSVFNLMTSPVPNNYKQVIAEFIDSQVTAGNWTKVRELWVVAMNTWQNTTIGWKGVVNGGFRARLAGYTPGQGIDYDGSTDHVNLGYRANTHGGGIVTLNNAGYGLYCVHSDNPGTQNLTAMGVSDRIATNNITTIIELGTLNTIGWQVHENNLNQDADEEVLDDDTVYIARRTASNLTQILEDQTVLGGTANTSTGLPVDEVYGGARNAAGVTSFHFNGEQAAYFVIDTNGFDYASFIPDFKTMISDLRALPSIPVVNPYPDTHRIGILFWGQSNALGANGISAPPTQFQGAISNVFVRTGVDTYATLEYNVNNGHLGVANTSTGSNMSLCKYLQKMYGRDIYLATVAVSGAGLFAGDSQVGGFSPSEAKTYPDLEASALDLQNHIIGLGKIPIIIQVIIQGERDTVGETEGSAWKTNMEIIQDSLTTAGLTTDSILVAPLSGNQSNGPAMNTVITKQNEYINAHDNVYSFELTDLPLIGDNIHYTGNALVRAGERIFDGIRDNILL